MVIHKVQQKTQEWLDLKKEYPFSASKAQAIATGDKGLETLIDEAIITHYSVGEKEKFTSSHLDRGNELEEQARSLYSLQEGVVVEEVGFVTDENYPFAGVSPDGLIDIEHNKNLDEDGLLEIKCLADNVYIKKLYEYAEKGHFKIDTSHEWQMQMQMLFTRRNWCDYVIYNPNFKKRLLRVRCYRDEVKQQKLITGLKMAERMYLEKRLLMDKLN